jgi:hypothetical protein
MWSNPEIQHNNIVARYIRYRVELPSLLNLVVAFKAILQHTSQYSIATCHHCMWLADSLSVVLECTFMHKVIVASDLQGRWRCIQMHSRDEGEVDRMVEEMTLAKVNMKVQMLDLTQYIAFELIVKLMLGMKLPVKSLVALKGRAKRKK